jgi:membrane complex biogenesis BtpA family protein
MASERILLAGLRRPIIGMIHLKALPGTPGYRGSLDEVIDAAIADALALDEGGIDAMMVENYGDVPFRKGSVEPHTIAAMTLAARAIGEVTRKPLGINVLRNDPLAALGIASACGAAMIRVNVHTGAMVTDQGVIEGNANATLDYRTKLGTRALLLADVHVKHAAPLAAIGIETAAADTVERGLADAVIVTGSRTGAGCDREELARVRGAVAAPVLIGSGITAESAAMLLAECDGAIVGSWLKIGGDVAMPVDRERVTRLMDAARAARGE